MNTKVPLQRAAPVATLVVGTLFLSACLEEPGIGRAAAPSHANTRGPVMGSFVTNQDLQKKVEILEALLDGRIDAAAAARRIDEQFRDLSPEEQEQRVGSLKEALAEAGRATKGGRSKVEGPARDMVIARLYFSERRFIDAAMLLSRILDQDPRFPTARNLLARCFYFLGNPDRTIAELEFILNDPQQSRDLGERLDALFLIGAAVVEQPGTGRENLEKGLWAWETYLKEAPESPQRDQVKEGLEEIRAGIAGEGRLAEAPVVRREAALHTGQNVMGGEASFEQPAPSGPAGPQGDRPPPERLKRLSPDAPPAMRALAAGLDALDLGNVALAEQELLQANQLSPGHAEVLVGLGRVYVQTGRIDESLRTFGEAIKLHPDYMPAWHYNGMAHMMGGDGRQAAESWEHIMKTDPAYAQQFSLDRRAAVARQMTR